MSPLKETGAPASTPKTNQLPGYQRDLEQVCDTNREYYSAWHQLLRWTQRQFVEVVLLIEQKCSRMETAHELAKWNGGNR
jgi:hypothetical protein